MTFIAIKIAFKDRVEAQSVARGLVRIQLVASVQMKEMESYYVWQDDMCEHTEYELTCYTSDELYDCVCEYVTNNHSYVVPQIVATKLDYVADSFKTWLEGTLR